MNLERGFRRLVVTVSFAAASVGLLVTRYDTYRTVKFVSGTNRFVACSEDPKLLNLTVPIEGVSVPYCLTILSDAGLPDHLKHVIAPPISACPCWWIDWLPDTVTTSSYTLALLPLIGGVLMSTGLGVLPWAAFYLVRWIVQGFKE
jgi:hypothetical protein